MVRVNFWIFVLAENFQYFFFKRSTVRLEDDIDARVEESLAEEVVVGMVVGIDSTKAKNIAEFLESKISSFVVWVHIGISSQEK